MKQNWKGYKVRNRHENRIKRSGQAWLVYVCDINHNIPTGWRWACGTHEHRCWYWEWDRVIQMYLRMTPLMSDHPLLDCIPGPRYGSVESSILFLLCADEGYSILVLAVTVSLLKLLCSLCCWISSCLFYEICYAHYPHNWSFPLTWVCVHIPKSPCVGTVNR